LESQIDYEKKGFTEENESKTIQYQFIIAKLLATDKIKIENNEFFYKDTSYHSANKLNKVINKELSLNTTFTQYLNDHRSKTGEKYLLETHDSQKKPITKNINRLRKIRDYLNENNITITNIDFINAFKRI
jgi:hypothetical protein